MNKIWTNVISFAQKLENPIWALSILSNDDLSKRLSFVVFTETNTKTLTKSNIPSGRLETGVCREHSDATAASEGADCAAASGCYQQSPGTQNGSRKRCTQEPPPGGGGLRKRRNATALTSSSPSVCV